MIREISGICDIMFVFPLLAVLYVAATAAGQTPAAIAIDYPLDGSIFPPEITAPLFVWHDPADKAVKWRISVGFTNGQAGIQTESKGARLQLGEIDPRCVAETNHLPQLTPLEAAAHSWRPDPEFWTEIKRHSPGLWATCTITGYQESHPDIPISRGQVTFQISKDPVGAPIFYRDVPLMPTELEKGVIKPLVSSAVPLVSWRLKYIGESGSRLLMEGLPTCANCHSFSRDGKTMGMDVDGPQNDKGMYAVTPVTPQISIRTEDVFSWNSFPGKPSGQRTIGFMAQISPDGQYAVTTLNEDMYVVNFKDYRFLQVFYPTRGILAWRSRSTGTIKALPGADNPNFVQTDAVWSPDGKYLVFARAKAKEPYPEGRKLAEYANDPIEVPIQYDLYRIPFNAGKGGRAQPIAGASRNGMSNNFPKVSPDGRWIVFVQCRNGQLMRPDGLLYIVPAEGGQARRMRCNMELMNSWHSFSPNGRWLVFASKNRSPYTQMFLTHLDEEGNDSPAILIENATVANRAVNIPEFANIPPDGLLKIDVPAAEFYRLFDRAWSLAEKGQYEASIAEWNKALELSPDDAKAHNNLGRALAGKGDFTCAVLHWQKAVVINPNYAEAHNNLGVAAVRNADYNEAIAHFQKALAVYPSNAELHNNLASALAGKGKFNEAVAHWKQALQINPSYAEAYNDFGNGLFSRGKWDEAIAQWQKSLEAKPDFIPARYNLGRALARKGRIDEAIAQWQRAAAASKQPQFIASVAASVAEAGRFTEAAQVARQALNLAIQQNELQLAETLKSRIARYEAGHAVQER